MRWSIDFDSGAGSGDIPDGGASNSSSGSGATGTGSGLVYIDPVIWTERNPQVQCQPPCVLVLPPSPLPSPTTISFPPFTTSFIVQSVIIQGDSTLTSRVTIPTTISLPPVTTTEIEVWAVTVFSQDTTLASFPPVQSVTPSSFIITLPGSEALPPFATPTPTSISTTSPTSSTTVVPPFFFPSSHVVTIQPQPTNSIKITPMPSITYTTGPPKPTCTSRCGHHTCGIFGCGGGCGLFGCGGGCGLFGCGGGCGLFGCGGGCGVFGCGGGCGLPGCGSNCPGCGPGPPGGSSDGGDGDDREEDDPDTPEMCLLEMAGMADNFGSISQAEVASIDGYTPLPQTIVVVSTTTLPPPPPPPQSTVTSVVIVSAPSPPMPSPSQNPAPPTPDPSTEQLHCYGSGSYVDREDSINNLNSFCSTKEDADRAWKKYPHYGGFKMSNNQYIEYIAPSSLTSGWPVNIVIGVQGLNGCEFTIEGPNPDQNCGRILRMILDRCDTGSTQYKKGGTVTDNCSIWRFDPGFSADTLANDICDATDMIPFFDLICSI